MTGARVQGCHVVRGKYHKHQRRITATLQLGTARQQNKSEQKQIRLQDIVCSWCKFNDLTLAVTFVRLKQEIPQTLMSVSRRASAKPFVFAEGLEQ
jgi:hypothetical protein